MESIALNSHMTCLYIDDYLNPHFHHSDDVYFK